MREAVSRCEGTVLITGAIGGLGQALAEHLVRHYQVKHLVLLSRSASDKGEQLGLKLRQAGAYSVSLRACDVSDRERLEEILAEIPSQHPLVAIFHLAGVLRDGIFSNQSEQGLREVFAGKVEGAFHLHEFSQAHPTLSHFVLFSSAAGLFGNAGQANYAAANAALDSLAALRLRSGLPAQSLAWGGWGEVGMASTRTTALPLFSTADGLRALDRALAVPLSPLVVLPYEARDFAASDSVTRESPWTELLPPDLATLPAPELEALIAQLVDQALIRFSGQDESWTSQPDQSFFDIGIDSLMALEVRNFLCRTLACDLAPTFLFEFSTPAALVNHLVKQLKSSHGHQEKAKIARATFRL